MKLIFRLLSIIISVLFAVLGFTDTADGGKIDNQEKGEKMKMKKITKTIMHKIRSIRESHYTASSMEKLQTVGAFLVLELMIHALEFVYNDILHFTQADYEGFTEWVLLVTALMGIFVLVISDFIYALRLRFDRHRYKKHQNDESGTHNG